MERKISFFLVNYNSSDYTIDCINSLLTQIGASEIIMEIVVVDNNSQISEKKILLEWEEENKLDNIKILYSDKNLGYFGAFNHAFSFFDVSRSSFTVIANNDLVFSKSFVSDLFSKKYEDQIFVVSPDIINSNNIHQNPIIINNYSIIRRLYYYLYNSNYYIAVFLESLMQLLKLRHSQKSSIGFDKSQIISVGFGACYILTKAFFEKYKKLDDYVFLMQEENVLANQVLKGGGKTFYDNSLKVIHKDKSSFKKIPSIVTYRYNQKSFWISRKYFKLSSIQN